MPARSSEHDASEKAEKKLDSLVCRVKYTNTLPDLAFDPKFINYPFDTNRFVQYNSTSLERNHKHELLTEQDAGVEIDLVDQDAFAVDPGAKLHPSDERLLEDDLPTTLDATRSRYHNKTVSWLRKTEYLSTELYNKVSRSEKIESRIGYNVKHMLGEDNMYRDRQSQITAIEKTFTDASATIQTHYSKRGVHAVEVLPIFPDFTNWKHPCAQVIFDAEPVQVTKANPDALTDATQAMIRGMVDDTGDEFVAFFLPTEDTKRKRKRDQEESKPYEEGDEYDYLLTREYKWKFRNKSFGNFEENYFFVFRDDGVYYNEMETRVRLNKRRKFSQPGGNAQSTSTQKNTRLRVRHRTFTDEEYRQQTARLAQLDPVEEEEDEESEEEVAAKNVESSADEDADTTEEKQRSEQPVGKKSGPPPKTSATKSKSSAKRALSEDEESLGSLSSSASSDSEGAASPPANKQAATRKTLLQDSDGDDDATSSSSSS